MPRSAKTPPSEWGAEPSQVASTPNVQGESPEDQVDMVMPTSSPFAADMAAAGRSHQSLAPG
jgi:hypothetical protein